MVQLQTDGGRSVRGLGNSVKLSLYGWLAESGEACCSAIVCFERKHKKKESLHYLWRADTVVLMSSIVCGSKYHIL